MTPENSRYDVGLSGAQYIGSQWLSLARLEGEVAAAAGVGASAAFSLSADKGRLILRLKAALILGPGAKGTFAFEVGYDAVYELLNPFRRELHSRSGIQRPLSRGKPAPTRGWGHRGW